VGAVGRALGRCRTGGARVAAGVGGGGRGAVFCGAAVGVAGVGARARVSNVGGAAPDKSVQTAALGANSDRIAVNTHELVDVVCSSASSSTASMGAPRADASLPRRAIDSLCTRLRCRRVRVFAALRSLPIAVTSFLERVPGNRSASRCREARSSCLSSARTAKATFLPQRVPSSKERLHLATRYQRDTAAVGSFCALVVEAIRASVQQVTLDTASVGL